MVLSKVIKEYITRNGENKIYTVSDFADLNNDMLVTRVLSRLKEEQFLIRLSQGIYLYPSRNRFGICKPSIDQIANAIAEDTEEKEKVNHDYRIAPQWIRKKLKAVLYGNK